jgi:hypothetical protein
MARWAAAALTRALLLASLAIAFPGAAAAATPFELSSVGGSPALAVDGGGNGHFVWNESPASPPDVTHYCKVPPAGTTCTTSSTFVPPADGGSANNADFDGPQVFVGGNAVIVMTHRCCGGFGAAGSDGVFIYVSTDGGVTFGPAELVGNQEMSGDAIVGPTGRLSTISDVVTGGTFYQAHTPGSFTSESANLGDSGPNQSYNGSLGLIDANTPIATFDDLETTFWRRYTGSGSHNDVASWTATAAVGPGEDGELAHGPSGVWLMYRVGTPGSTVYVARPFTGTGFGTPVQLTETGDPIFADYFQDFGGRLHVVWLQGDRALMYRRSENGTSYGPPTQLAAPSFEIFHLEIGAGADGNGWVVWDQNNNRAAVRAVALEVAPERPEPPVVGKTVTAAVVKGEVSIKLPPGAARASQKGGGFVPLTEARSIPVRSILDTTRGTVRLSSARNRKGKIQSGEFAAGVFQVLQSRKKKQKGLTELRLKGSAAGFRSCRSGKRTAVGGTSRLSRRTIRRLRARARGRYRSRGRHSAATVRGTVWTVADRCDGTLTTVKRGKVAVRDFRLRKTILLRRGKRYLAPARG